MARATRNDVRSPWALVALAAISLGCYPNPNDINGHNPAAGGAVGGGGAGGAGGNGTGLGGSGTGAGGATTGAGGGRGGTSGGGAGGAGGSTCTNAMFPTLCPANGLVPASCWSVGTVCSTVTDCGGGKLAACQTAGLVPACGSNWCVTTAEVSVAQAWCTKLETCAPTYFSYTYVTMAACLAAEEVTLGIATSPPDTGWTATTLGSCANAIAGEVCPAFIEGLPAACAPAGARANGTACVGGAQCASFRCVFGAGASCGTCAALAGQNGACLADDDCAAGLICASVGACVTPVGSGLTCNTTNLPCRRSDTCRGSICVTPGRAGIACTATTDCDVLNGFACNFLTGQCGAVVQGPTCGSNADGTVGGCAARGFCGQNGVCIGAAVVGGACDDTSGPLCSPPASCSSGGTCTIVEPPVMDCPVANMSALPVDTPAGGMTRAFRLP